MAATKNDVTGDRIVSKASTDAYRNNKFWDKVKENAKQSELQEGLQDGVQEAGSFNEGQEAEGKE